METNILIAYTVLVGLAFIVSTIITFLDCETSYGSSAIIAIIFGIALIFLIFSF